MNPDPQSTSAARGTARVSRGVPRAENTGSLVRPARLREALDRLPEKSGADLTKSNVHMARSAMVDELATPADRFLTVPEVAVAVVAPHLVDYAFVRYLKRRGIKIIEVSVDEYWDLAVNGVTLDPGKVIMNRAPLRLSKRSSARGSM